MENNDENNNWFWEYLSSKNSIMAYIAILGAFYFTLQKASQDEIKGENLDAFLDYAPWFICLMILLVAFKTFAKMQLIAEKILSFFMLIAFILVVTYSLFILVPVLLNQYAEKLKTPSPVIIEDSTTIKTSNPKILIEDKIMFDTVELMFDGNQDYSKFSVDGKQANIISHYPIILQIPKSGKPQTIIAENSKSICTLTMNFSENSELITIDKYHCKPKN